MNKNNRCFFNLGIWRGVSSARHLKSHRWQQLNLASSSEPPSSSSDVTWLHGWSTLFARALHCNWRQKCRRLLPFWLRRQMGTAGNRFDTQIFVVRGKLNTHRCRCRRVRLLGRSINKWIKCAAEKATNHVCVPRTLVSGVVDTVILSHCNWNVHFFTRSAHELRRKQPTLEKTVFLVWTNFYCDSVLQRCLHRKQFLPSCRPNFPVAQRSHSR